MNKVINAEIKKTLSKPGVYILAVFLALILILGVFIYNPKENFENEISLNGNSVIEKYNDFIGNSTFSYKTSTDNKINSSTRAINNYFVGELTVKQYVENLKNEYQTSLDKYKASAYDDSTAERIENLKNEFISKLNNLNSYISNCLILPQNYSYPILTTEENYDKYFENIKNIETWAKKTITDKTALQTHFKSYEENYKDKLNQNLSEFIYPSLSNEFINSYTNASENSNLKAVNEKLNEIYIKMQQVFENARTDDTINISQANQIDKLANEYIYTAETYQKLVRYELISNAFNSVSETKSLSIKFLNQESKYNSNSLLIKYRYIFQSNKTEQDYANPLTIGVASNTTKNAYDYAYFVLRLFSCVIIVYAIMTASFAIAGEIKEGSMRYYAIRPISRTQILLGKLLSTLIISSILFIFSFAISLLVGGFIYGFSSKTILTIFNGSTLVTIKPIIMLLIYLISVFVELIIYTCISLMLSTLLKSDLVTLVLVIVLYLFNLMLPMFVQGASSWLMFYPFSHISFYALWGSSLFAINSNFYNILFGAKVFTNTNLILYSIISLVLIIIPIVVAINMFKRKEL